MAGIGPLPMGGRSPSGEDDHGQPGGRRRDTHCWATMTSTACCTGSCRTPSRPTVAVRLTSSTGIAPTVGGISSTRRRRPPYPAHPVMPRCSGCGPTVRRSPRSLMTTGSTGSSRVPGGDEMVYLSLRARDRGPLGQHARGTALHASRRRRERATATPLRRPGDDRRQQLGARQMASPLSNARLLGPTNQFCAARKHGS